MADVSNLPSYKNRLQELLQKSNMDVPMYRTTSQGCKPESGFKSSVVVDGVLYTSEKIFPKRKAAEQHIAMMAFEGASQKIKSDALSLISKDPIFCKTIVNEYVSKMNLEKPVYHTVKEEGLLQVFTSSLVFNEVKYTGEVCRTKKDSELLAARALIISILGKSDTGIMMAAIVKSKSKKHYDLLNNGRTIAPQDPEKNLVIQPESQVEELVVVTRTDDNSKGLLLPHTTNVHHPDPSDNSKGLLQLVPLSLDFKSLDVEGGGPPANGKRLMNNSTAKNNKKLCINAQVDSSVAEMKMGQVLADVVHSNEAPSCSVGP